LPEIVFDGKKITVPAGTNLIEAGLEAGVPVPVFCYHKDLGAVGSCRVCAVTVTQQGKSRLVMGCMTDAADGMEVTTLDAASVKLRKYVLEWLMVNHPHDCPICDEGGECQLQDLTIAAGHSQRRVEASGKRTFKNQHLGEFIVHEMNRCITCYRCSRFYQEVAGGRDFGVTGSRDRVYFGRFEDGPLESPFSGNLIELCPTGVFTDKLFRYKSRVWDLEIAPSICPHCSVGCNVLPGARHRMLQRIRVNVNDQVNGPFLCDRGQFGHAFVHDPARPKEVRVRGEHSAWDQALGMAGATLMNLAREHGAGSIALIASARASLETHVALEALASGPLEDARVSHFDDPQREPRALAALAALRSAGAPPLEQADIANCDVLLVAGTALIDEAPLAALAARQVARRGGRLFVVNAGERYLNDVAEHVSPVHPAMLAASLAAITARVSKGDASPDGDAANLAAALRGGKRVGILLGSDLMDGPAFAAGAGLARALAAAGVAVRLGCVFPGPNGFGAAALSRGGTLAGTLDALESGELKAAVIVESDLAEWGAKAREALGRLELLVIADYLAGPVTSAAPILLPTTVTYESHGIYVNRAGRAQAFAPDRVPGVSVIEMIHDETFPRAPRLSPPESDARPAWWVLEQLRELSIGKPRARGLNELRAQFQRSDERWRPLGEVVAGGTGALLDASRFPVEAPQRFAAFAPSDRGLAVFRSDRVLGSETLSRRSSPIMKMAGPPVALVSPADAERLRGDGLFRITIDGASATVAFRASATVPAGVVLLPRDVDWPGRIAQGTLAQVAADEVAGARA
jgi:NADH-quinone oxidoreductase subunit G